jgi:hypothetical protein
MKHVSEITKIIMNQIRINYENQEKESSEKTTCNTKQNVSDTTNG